MTGEESRGAEAVLCVHEILGPSSGFWNSLAGRTTAPYKDSHVLMPRIYECCLMGQKDVTELGILRRGDHPVFSMWTQGAL